MPSCHRRYATAKTARARSPALMAPVYQQNGQLFDQCFGISRQSVMVGFGSSFFSSREIADLLMPVVSAMTASDRPCDLRSAFKSEITSPNPAFLLSWSCRASQELLKRHAAFDRITPALS